MATTMGVAGSARAEEPAPAPAAAPASPDLVLLKDGGMLRGTISELVPGETVTIVTVAGKTRELSMDEVSYAGPADKAPQPENAEDAKSKDDEEEPAAEEDEEKKSEAYVTVRGKRATLHLQSTVTGVTFYRAASSAVAVGSGGVAVATGYDRLCTAPCDVSMPAGTETFALARDGRPPQDANAVTFGPGKSTLEGSYISRSGVRSFGWVLLVGSVVGGAFLVYDSFQTEPQCGIYGCTKEDIKPVEAAAGIVLLSAGIPIGIVLGVMPDKPKVELASGPPSPVGRGITLNGTF